MMIGALMSSFLALGHDVVESGSNALMEEVGRCLLFHFLLPLVVHFAGLDQHCLPHNLAISDNQAGVAVVLYQEVKAGLCLLGGCLRL